MKIMILGASHGGMESLDASRKLYPDAEIEMIEHDDLGHKMGWTKEEKMAKLTALAATNTLIKENTEMIALMPSTHQVQLADLITGTISTANYDKLILAPGAQAVQLPIPGLDNQAIMSLRSKADMNNMRLKAGINDIKNIVIIGAGYIEMGAVEPFVTKGKHVTVIDTGSRVLGSYLDSELTDSIEADLKQRGVTLALGERVKQFDGDTEHRVTQVITDKKVYPADLVILSVGTKPNTDWLQGTLELSSKGIIQTDEYQYTSAADVFAIGDATDIFYTPANQKMNISLAGNARRQARNAVRNLVQPSVSLHGVQGTSALPLFDFKFATTGLSGQMANKLGIPTGSVIVEAPANLLPNAEKIQLKLRYRSDNLQLVGAQLMSTVDHTELINVLSMAINQKLTLTKLMDEDFFFQPVFTGANNIIVTAAEQALLNETATSK